MCNTLLVYCATHFWYIVQHTFGILCNTLLVYCTVSSSLLVSFSLPARIAKLSISHLQHTNSDCCIVLQCVAVCIGNMSCQSATYNTPIQIVALCCTVLHCVAVCVAIFLVNQPPTTQQSRLLRCVALCCSVLHCLLQRVVPTSHLHTDSDCCSVLQYVVLQYVLSISHRQYTDSDCCNVCCNVC